MRRIRQAISALEQYALQHPHTHSHAHAPQTIPAAGNEAARGHAPLSLGHCAPCTLRMHCSDSGPCQLSTGRVDGGRAHVL